MSLHRRMMRHRRRMGHGATIVPRSPRSFARIIDAMTNWQRHQWAKAGGRDKDARHFQTLIRPS